MTAIERYWAATPGGRSAMRAATNASPTVRAAIATAPNASSLARAKRLEERRSELLPNALLSRRLHLPEGIAAIALQNKAMVYGILFRAAAETPRRIAADPKHLGAELRFSPPYSISRGSVLLIRTCVLDTQISPRGRL